MIRLFAMLPLLAALCSCATPPAPPAQEWRSVDHALSIMAERAARLSTVSGTAALTLRRGDGNEVRLDSAFAARPPEALRIRAWKFDRAVADWTLREDGVWVWQSADAQERAPVPTLWTSRHGEVWPLLFGVLDRRPGDQIRDEGGATFALHRSLGEAAVIIVIDRAMLTVSECRIVGADGQIIQRAELGDYRTLGETVWPMRVIATGSGGSFTLDFGEVTINEELAENAFTPPARAKRIP